MKTESGQIQVYTGDGKGKTTAALGLAMRAIGNGLKVGMIFFDKGGAYYGERKILDDLKKDGLQYQVFGLPRMTAGKGFRFKNEPGDLAEAQKALALAKKWIKSDLSLLILDEVNTTIKTGLLKLENVLELIGLKPEKLELVLTGRYAPPEIIELADLVTEMKPLKHYINKGLGARPGIEY
ncbi:MAG: cob(I)yrinic acid a,c-diamide adenosyltransferase [Parcubacteria group bacterium]|nr:MAG: cob(I)yrinic acid a,c-diamide adenosyltransferase [Parcubacteria group bacterium]